MSLSTFHTWLMFKKKYKICVNISTVFIPLSIYVLLISVRLHFMQSQLEIIWSFFFYLLMASSVFIIIFQIQLMLNHYSPISWQCDTSTSNNSFFFVFFYLIYNQNKLRLQQCWTHQRWSLYHHIYTTSLTYCWFIKLFIIKQR